MISLATEPQAALFYVVAFGKNSGERKQLAVKIENTKKPDKELDENIFIMCGQKIRFFLTNNQEYKF